MYLSVKATSPTFVLSKGKNILAAMNNILNASLIVLCLLISNLVQGQMTLWPGDVNNNGEVNSWDVLYWTVAASKQVNGPSRQNQSTSWSRIEIAEDLLWDQSFPTDINYLFADCNGDGQIDKDDLEVIRSNFGQDRPGVVPEKPLDVNNLEDPILRLVSQQIDTVRNGDSISFQLDLSEGTENSINNFWAIAFTIEFDPGYIEDRMDGSDKFDYAIVNGATFLGNFPDSVDFFAQQNRIPNQENQLHVVVYRTQTPLTGIQSLGEIGRATAIVGVEDLIFGPTTIFEITEIVLINQNLEQTPVNKGDKKEVSILELLSEDTTSVSALNEKFGDPNKLKSYPIPTKEDLFIEFKEGSKHIDQIKIFDLQGKLLLSKTINAPTATLNLRPFANGQYHVIIYQDDTIYIKTIHKH